MHRTLIRLVWSITLVMLLVSMAVPAQAAVITSVNFRWDGAFSGGSIIADRCITANYHWLTSEEISPAPRRLGSWRYGGINGCVGHYPAVGVVDGDVIEIGIGASDSAPGTDLFSAVGTRFYRVRRVGNSVSWQFSREITPTPQPPNTPALLAPGNGSTTTASTVTLQVQDTGDPDNAPRNYRDFFFRIEKTDGSWGQDSGWVSNSWSVSLPSTGSYRWRAQSGDGANASAWSGWWTFNRDTVTPVNQPPNTPALIAPLNTSITRTASVTLQVQDTGDPDNGPRNYRDFFFRIEKTDGSWGQDSGWRGTTWPLTVPSKGTYRWRAQSGDGGAASAWSGWVTFTYSSAIPPTTPPPVPPPAPGMWNVHYYSQGDPQWGGTKMGQRCGTIRDVGCALTSVAMIFRYYGVDKNPGTLYSCMGGAACPLAWGSPTIASCSGGRVRWVDRPAFSYARLEQELKKGPVILEIRKTVDQLHFIVVLGGSGTNPANYTVNDPGLNQGARTKLSNTLSMFRGYTPSSMRLYTGTPALTATQSDLSQTVAQAELVSPTPTAGEVITGALELYRNTETEMTLELASQSSAGTVTEMQVWTDREANDVWQPFAPYVNVPLDSTFYVRFRDTAGNTSAVISAGVPSAPEDIQQNLSLTYLPVTTR